MELETLLKNYKTLVEHRLESLLSLEEIKPKKLIEAARYSTLSNAKRLRPLFVLSALFGFNIPIEQGLDPACAIELIHTYSLIHDDLPCMDNDDYRRGRPTLHKVYPEGIAVLTGDFLLTLAFETLSKASYLSPAQKLNLIQILSMRSGMHGMIGGQVVDLYSEGSSIDIETLNYMHTHKTAALFSACLEFSGIIAKVSTEDLKKLKSCGHAFGIAFQFIDDLQDDCEAAKSSDFTNKKATAVTLLGREQAELKSRLLLEEALQLASTMSSPQPLLKTLILHVLDQIVCNLS